jgi:hypothetical protein
MKLTKKVAAATAVAALAIGGGAAFAYFSVTASGSGDATVAAPASTSVSVKSVFAAPDLGGQSTVSYVAAKQANAVTLNKLKSAPVLTVTPANEGMTCPTGNFTLSEPTWVSTFPMTVDATTESSTEQTLGSATLSFVNKADTNQDGCKGATLNIAFSVE